MTYNPATRLLDLSNRPAFIITDPATMTHPTAMLHHRVSWGVLGGAMNQVLSGDVDASLINSLLRLSPASTGKPIKEFKAALKVLLKRNQPVLSTDQQNAIEAIEQLIFTIPCNLFQGPTGRADDPGEEIDFLSGDVSVNGTIPHHTDLGKAQDLREKVFNGLTNLGKPLALEGIQEHCIEWAKVWQRISPPGKTSRNRATGFNIALWDPGAAPLTTPGFRRWIGPSGQAIDAAASRALTAKVMSRVNSLRRK